MSNEKSRQGTSNSLALKVFIKGTSIYTIASILQAIFPLLTLPFIARQLSVMEFGFVETFIVSNAFIIAISSTPAVSTFNFFCRKQNKRLGIGAALQGWYLGPGVVLTLLCTAIFSYFINWDIFGTGKLIIFLFATIFFLSNQFISAMINVMRMSEQPYHCATFLILNSASVSGFATACCLFFDNYSLVAYLGGLFAANLCMAVIGFSLVRNLCRTSDLMSWNFVIVINQWKRFFIFGCPLIPAALAEVSLSYLDRIIVLHLSNNDTLGEYAMASRVASIVSLTISGVVMALAPYTLKLIHNSNKQTASQGIGDVWRYHSLLCMLLCCALAVMAPYLIELIGGSAYQSASNVMPWLALSIAFYSFTHYTYLGTLKTERTMLFSISVLVGLIIIVVIPLIMNVLLNMVDVPRTVAINRMVGTLAVVLISLGFSQILYPLKLPFYTVSAQSAIAISFVVFMPLIDNQITRFGLLFFVAVILLLISVRASDYLLIKKIFFKLP